MTIRFCETKLFSENLHFKLRNSFGDTNSLASINKTEFVILCFILTVLSFPVLSQTTTTFNHSILGSPSPLFDQIIVWTDMLLYTSRITGKHINEYLRGKLRQHVCQMSPTSLFFKIQTRLSHIMFSCFTNSNRLDVKSYNVSIFIY